MTARSSAATRRRTSLPHDDVSPLGSRAAGRLLACAALILMTSACSALQLISSTSPSSHYEKTAGVQYAPGDRRRLDLYEPVDLDPAAPTLVFFYGGGWRSGSREKYEFVASALTEAGFRVVIPDYRLYPEVQFPDFMQDAAKAVAWAVARFGLEAAPDNEASVYLVGHSAGAQIAALLAVDGRFLERESVPTSTIAGLIGLSGPYDFLPLKSGYLQDVFPQDQRDASQPIRFVSPSAPPALLIHGEDDDVVEPGNSERFAEALLREGVAVELKQYPGTGHARVAVALAPRLEFLADTLDDIVDFIKGQRRR